MGEMLHVVFAIPGERLNPDPAPDGVRYALRFRLIVSDSNDHLVARVDTLRVFAAHQPLRNPAYLTGLLAVPLAPGQYRYRLLVTSVDGSAGDLVFDGLHVVTRVHRGIALRDVGKGNYRLTVVLTDPASGVRVTRSQRFQVVAR